MKVIRTYLYINCNKKILFLKIYLSLLWVFTDFSVLIVTFWTQTLVDNSEPYATEDSSIGLLYAVCQSQVDATRTYNTTKTEHTKNEEKNTHTNQQRGATGHSRNTKEDKRVKHTLSTNYLFIYPESWEGNSFHWITDPHAHHTHPHTHPHTHSFFFFFFSRRNYHYTKPTH